MFECNFNPCTAAWKDDHLARLVLSHLRATHGIRSIKSTNANQRIKSKTIDDYTGKTVPKEFIHLLNWTRETRKVLLYFCLNNVPYTDIYDPLFKHFKENRANNVPALKQRIEVLDRAIVERLKAIFKTK
ncbi:hypothetical protein DASC09_004640 [Saccharomycopsis crataegensis]|uniref:Uncharacterized protein n=1 Tax=Saccharomycopsis crataegensis TaxID=43959 RepID=A0AAV5QEP9_9ASCO|nr:hypothetical protein DASC09_004640 [Saccharomycopsis crataegensis]